MNLLKHLIRQKKIDTQIEWFLNDREEKGLPLNDKKKYLEKFVRMVNIDDVKRLSVDDLLKYQKSISEIPGSTLEIVYQLRTIRFFLRFCRRIGIQCLKPDLIGDLFIKQDAPA